jgi:hypothetical protein
VTGIEGGMDFFLTCEENIASLENSYHAHVHIKNENEQTIIQRFIHIVNEAGRVAVNLRPEGLRKFLLLNNFFNIHEKAEWESRESLKPKEQIIKENLGEYYDRRIAFDRQFITGEKFKYGALNIGGLGAYKYGEFCVVISKNVLETQNKLGYLRRDSLNHYMTPDFKVNLTILMQDCAPDSHKHLLAVLKHMEEILTLEEKKWAAMLCNSEDYIEAIFNGEMTAGHIASVRIDEPNRELYRNYVLKAYREGLNDLESAWMGTFYFISQQLEKLGLEWEVVESV